MLRKFISRPLLKWIDENHMEYVLNKVHIGIWGMHTRGLSIAAKVIRASYYWLTWKIDYAEYVKTYKECQEFDNVHHASSKALHSITSPWPFSMWGINILVQFPTTKGQVKFLLIMVDYFTKWIEVEPLATITTQKVQKFAWKNIIYKYDLP